MWYVMTSLISNHMNRIYIIDDQIKIAIVIQISIHCTIAECWLIIFDQWGFISKLNITFITVKLIGQFDLGKLIDHRHFLFAQFSLPYLLLNFRI